MIAGGTEDNPLIKLIDFGVACDYSEERGDSRHNRYVGKTEYMAPEVENLRKWVEVQNLSDDNVASDPFAVDVTLVANEEEATFDPYAADVWCLGVCLWLLLFREYPFTPKKEKEGNDLTELPLDKIELIEKKRYLKRRIIERGLLPMITPEALSVLELIFKKEDERISARQLAQHPFCDFRNTGEMHDEEMKEVN